MRTLALLLLAACCAPAQTLGQLRLLDFSPRSAITVASFDPATGIVTTTAAHGLSSGPVYIFPMPSPLVDNSNSTINFDNLYLSRGRGYFNITVTDSTHFHLDSEMYTNQAIEAFTVTAASYVSGSSTATLTIGTHDLQPNMLVAIGGVSPSGYNKLARITAVTSTTISYIVTPSPGTYISGGTVSRYGTQAGDRVIALSTYYLKDGPIGWLDGPVNKGSWAAGTYKALEMVSAPDGNSYECISYLGCSTQPPSSDWLQVDPTKVGPGTFIASMRNTSGKANQTPWTPLTQVNSLLNTYWTGVGATYDYTQNAGLETGSMGSMTAWRWLALNSSSDYTAALHLVTQAEDLAGGGPACDETTDYCGHRTNDVDYARTMSSAWGPGMNVLYETLSSAQKNGLADRLLNDNDVLGNGIEAIGSGCVNEGYLPSNLGIMTYGTTGGAQIGTVPTGGLSGLTDLLPGSIIYASFPGTSTKEAIGRVKSVDSDTQLTFEKPSGGVLMGSPYANSNLQNGQYWWYSHPFEYNSVHSCGVKWFFQHHASSPHFIPGEEWRYGTLDYAKITSDEGRNNNRTLTGTFAAIMLGLLNAKHDLRGVRLAEQAINYYMSVIMAQEEKSRWTGFDGHGTQYGMDRTGGFSADIAYILKNSLTVTPPGLITGVYLKHHMGLFQNAVIASHPTWVMPWSTGYGQTTGGGAHEVHGLNYELHGEPLRAMLFPSDPYAGVTWDYYRSRRADYGNISESTGWGSEYALVYGFPLYDPLATATAASTMPLQFAGIQTDQQECIASSLYCRVDSTEGMAFSRTGWGNTDTQVLMEGQSSNPAVVEDNYLSATNFNIVQNTSTGPAWLLGGNGLSAGGFGTADTPHSGAYHANTLSIYNASTQTDLWNTGFAYASMDRWAGDPINGVADNSYAYARVNLHPMVRDASTRYTSSVQMSYYAASANLLNGTREIVHAKSGAGQPNYIVTYDWLNTGTANQLRSYLHLQTSTTDPSAPVDHKEWVTYNGATKTATLQVPSPSAKLNVKLLKVPGSANADVALVNEAYAPNTVSHISSISCSGTTATASLSSSYPIGALPTDGSVSITIAGNSIAGYNGTFTPTATPLLSAPGKSTELTLSVSYPVAACSGTGTGGTLTTVPWCNGYANPYMSTETCDGNYQFTPNLGITGGIYPGTYRLDEGASSDGSTFDNETNGEWITVLQPSVGSSATMPTIAQPTCSATGGNCVVTEIQDATAPKVIAMMRQGALGSAMSFTTTHSGTADYILTGLAAGSYSVAQNGTTIASVSVPAGNADTSAKFSSTSGAFTITQTGSPTAFLAYSPSSLSFTISSAGTPSAPQSLSLSETNQTMTNFSIAPDATASWASVTPGSGISASTVSVSVSAAGLTPGTYSGGLTFDSADANLNAHPVTIPISVTYYSQPSISTSSLPAGTVGAAYSSALTGSGGLPPYSWTVSSGSLPPGLSLNATTGIISGTLTTAGTYTFTIQVSDSQSPSATASKAFTVTVGSGSVTISLSPTQVNLTCGGQQTITFTSPGGTLSSWASTKGLSSTVLSQSSGTTAANFTITLNCAGLTTGQNVSDTVSVSSPSADNSPATVQVLGTVAGPTVSTSSITDATWATPYSFGMSASGGAAGYAWTASGLPSGLLLSSDGTISGVPMIAGSYTIRLQATDANGVLSQQKTLPITVDFLPPSAILGGAAQTSGSGH